MKKCALFLILCSFLNKGLSQNDEISPGNYSYNGYTGFSLYRPNIKKGYETTRDWTGFEATFKDLVISFTQGQFRHPDADSTQANISGYNFLIGGRAGKDLSIFGGELSSFVIKPYIQPSFCISRFPTKNLKEGVTSMGFVLAPGLQVRFSQFYLAAQYNAGLHGNFSFGGKKYNLNRGFSGGLQLTAGINNGFDLLSPRTYTLTGNHVRSKSKTRTYNAYVYDPMDGKYKYARIKETTTITKRTPGEVSRYLMDPFFGFGPTYSFNFATRRQGHTSMAGGNIGIRISALSLDGFYETGMMGLKDDTDPEEILVTYPRLRNYDFSSSIQATQYGGRIGLNLLRLFNGFEPDEASRKRTEVKISFLRLNVFYGYGLVKFESPPEYTYGGAREKLTDFQSQQDILPSADNNPEYLPGQTNFHAVGGSLEIGSAFIKGTSYMYKGAKIANHSQWTVGANIPVGRLLKHATAKRRYKKSLKDQ